MAKTDIKSFDKIIEQISQFETLMNSGMLGMLGVDASKWKAQLKELRKSVDRYSEAINKFNPLFRDRGWIVSDHSKMELIEECIALAEAGRFDEAELALVEYYNPKHLQDIKFRFWHFQGLKDRYQLVNAALAEYEAGRFLSCTPLVLMIIDGFITDDHPDQKGFFASGHEVYHHDCIAAQRKGLEALYELFNRSRKSTNTQEIFVPYRNGILHGRDINYGNRFVAAKSWALLLALVDWRMKEKEPEQEEEKVQESLFEVMEKYNAQKAEIEKRQEAASKWKKPEYNFESLSIEEGLDYFEKDSPGYTASSFLSFWRDKKLGKMVPLIHYRIWGKKEEKPIKKKIQEMKDLHEIYDVSETKIIKVDIENSVLAEVHFTVKLGMLGDRTFRMRMMRVDDQGEPLGGGLEGGSWKIMDGMIWPVKD